MMFVTSRKDQIGSHHMVTFKGSFEEEEIGGISQLRFTFPFNTHMLANETALFLKRRCLLFTVLKITFQLFTLSLHIVTRLKE